MLGNDNLNLRRIRPLSSTGSYIPSVQSSISLKRNSLQRNSLQRNSFRNSFLQENEFQRPSLLLNSSINERRSSVLSRMSKDFNEDKTFIENYDVNYNFIDILKEDRKETALSIYKQYNNKFFNKNENDKNYLYEAKLKYKELLNIINEENSKIKAKIINMKKDKAKLNKIISDFENLISDNPTKKATETKCSNDIKIRQMEKKILERRIAISKQKEEIFHKKNNIKLINLSDLLSEAKVFNNESVNIRNSFIKDFKSMYEKKSKEISEFDYNQSINELNDKKNEISLQNDMLAKEIEQLQNEDEDKRTRKLNLDKKLKEITKNLEQTDKDLAKIMKEQLALKQRRDELERKSQIKSDEQLKVEALLNSEEKLKSIINERDQTIFQQEKAISDLKLKLQDKSTFELNEKTNLQNELNAYKEKCTDKEEQWKALDKLPNTTEKKKMELFKDKDINNNEMKESKYDTLEHKLSILADKNLHKEEKKYKIVKKVSIDDIQKTAYELKLRFILKKIDMNNIERYLFTEKILLKGIATIAEMKEILQRHPFNIFKEDEALLVARYLIEDNHNDTLELNFDRNNDIDIIRIILKKLVGRYTFMDSEYEERMKNELSFYVDRYGSVIKRIVNESRQHKSDVVGYHEIADILVSAFAFEKKILNNQQLEYIILKLFELSNDLTKLNMFKVFQIFGKK